MSKQFRFVATGIMQGSSGRIACPVVGALDFKDGHCSVSVEDGQVKDFEKAMAAGEYPFGCVLRAETPEDVPTRRTTTKLKAGGGDASKNAPDEVWLSYKRCTKIIGPSLLNNGVKNGKVRVIENYQDTGKKVFNKADVDKLVPPKDEK